MNRRSLENKNAVIHGAGGAIGGAIAREGARVFLAGRSLGKLEAVAKDVAAAGGVAETARVDALDERAVKTRADAVAMRAGHIDIAVNAVGIMHVQGTPSRSCPSRITPIPSRATRGPTSSPRRQRPGT